MNNPYRAMCSELVEQVQRAINNHGLCLEASDALMHRARALLAEPEAEGPTDEQLNDISARRPKPPSLKEQALKALTTINSNFNVYRPDIATIRRALEQLDD